jgi:germination protein M
MAAAKKAARHNQETILFILMGLIIVGLIISGYFLFVKKLLPELSNEEKGIDIQHSQQNNSAEDVQNARQVFIPDEDAQALTLYFAVKGKDALRAELRRVRRQKMLTAQARQILEELLLGPVEEDLYSALPQNTTLRGLFFESGTFIVDLSKEFSMANSYGAVEQLLAVYSLVNSLTELDPGAKVKILINGSEPTDEYGHVDLTHTKKQLPEIVLQ